MGDSRDITGSNFNPGDYCKVLPGFSFFVNETAIETQHTDGKSWDTAFADIQSGVSAASIAGGGQVWVARGTYTRLSACVLYMCKGVDIFGGFAGDERSIEERAWGENLTIIDGENIRRCVTGASNARLDGFTIARGFATEYGGGMYNYESSPTVTNCIFTENAAYYGGGMYNSFSSPTVTNCIFTENTAYYGGGGMYNWYSSPSVTNCIGY